MESLEHSLNKYKQHTNFLPFVNIKKYLLVIFYNIIQKDTFNLERNTTISDENSTY